MIKKIAIWFFMSLVVLIIFATGGYAAQYTLTDGMASGARSIDGHYWNGGAFLINDTNNTWESFCLERNEYISFGGTYSGDISGSAVNGGIGGGNPDPLDNRTAWLYTQYLDNIYAHTVGNTIAMQLAIWRIEQEFDDASGIFNNYSGYAYLGDGILGQATTYYIAANSHPSFLGNVGVLNLYHVNAQGIRIEDQSQLISVPEPGTLLLLGAGLLGLGIFGRKKVKKIKE